MDADEVHVQFGHRGEPHIIVTHHAAGHDAWSLHDAIIGHTEFLHVRQFAVAWQIGAGDRADFGNVPANHLPSFFGKDIGGRHIHRCRRGRQYGFLECDQFLQ